MFPRTYIEDQIKDDWRDNSQIGELCLLILDYVYSNKDSIRHISYGSLSSLTNGMFPIEHILMATQYLSGSKAQVLDLQFEFIDDDDESYGVSKKELSDAYKNNFFIHPRTGEVIQKNDFEKKIFQYFVPSKDLAKSHA